MTPRRGEVAPDLLAETLHQRCFWLFAALALLIVSVPFLEGTATGRIALHFASLLVLIAGAAAISRSAGAVIITALLALPTAVRVPVSRLRPDATSCPVTRVRRRLLRRGDALPP